MIIDAQQVPTRTVFEADICIIGSGPAGMAMAMAFDGKPFKVLMLEAGRLRRNRADQAQYAGDNVGWDYEDLDQARSRYFGGSSNCWAGFCRPMDEHDFEERDWVPNSGWPFGRQELAPYYPRTQSLLQLGPYEYDPKQWEAWLARPSANLVKFTRDRVRNMISQLSPPTRFGRVYRDHIARSQNVVCYVGANVTEIETPGNGASVTGLQVRTLSGGAFRVKARNYVLAAGGIETPRLLLVSNRYQPNGIGNQHDQVGRYFMDHPRLQQGTIHFNDPARQAPIYDKHVTFPGGMTAQGAKIAAFFSLSPEVQRKERLGNTRTYAVSRFAGDDPATYKAIGHLRQALHGAGSILERSNADVANVVRNLPSVALLAAGLKFKVPFLKRGYSLETIIEPTPDPDSRVTLNAQRDRLGMQRVTVDWRPGELEKRTIRRTQEILGQELVRAGAGSVTVDAPADSDPWPKGLNGCWHHMGTARMHQDPRKGVVDANCQVHGMENLHIAGSCVFPTGGADFPTITLVSLALRLADRLAARETDVRMTTDRSGANGASR